MENIFIICIIIKNAKNFTNSLVMDKMILQLDKLCNIVLKQYFP